MTNDDRKIREKLQQKTWNEIKTNDSWAIFKIMAEFVEGYEKLSKIGPSVSIFGSARTKPGDPFYELDDQMPDSISDRRKRLKQKNAPDLTITATFIAQLNNEKKEMRLKQFMEPQAAKRSNY